MHWRIAIYFNETYFSQPFGWLKKKLILCMLMWNVDVKCVFNSFQFFFFSYPFWFLGSHSVQVLSKILERKDKIIPEWKLTTNTNTSSNKYINAIKYLRALYSLSLSLSFSFSTLNALMLFQFIVCRIYRYFGFVICKRLK